MLSEYLETGKEAIWKTEGWTEAKREGLTEG